MTCTDCLNALKLSVINVTRAVKLREVERTGELFGELLDFINGKETCVAGCLADLAKATRLCSDYWHYGDHESAVDIVDGIGNALAQVILRKGAVIKQEQLHDAQP